MNPTLSSVSTALSDPPYPSNTKSNGYKIEIDWDRIRQSKTWTMADHDVRPWLLLLWVQSRENVPSGSWDSDHEYIARSIGCEYSWFQVHQAQLMRGWVKHSDGRLYHPYITHQVLEMLRRRKSSSERQRKKRADVTRESQHVTRDSQGTYAQEQEQEQEVHPCTITPQRPVDACQALQHDQPQPPAKPKSKRRNNPCPYERIRELWLGIVVPESGSIIEPMPAADWSASRKNQIKARWCDQLPDLPTWEAFFRDLTKSPWLMGRRPGKQGQFKLDLFWITKPEFYSRFAEGKYDG